MKDSMEELIPIVGRLAEAYTGLESTSLTYEKAEQLMGAVRYCIREAETFGGESVIPLTGILAEQAYETGVRLVGEKVRNALNLYNEIRPDFISCGNRCLQDTIEKGLPEFFRWYDVKFKPQDTVIFLEYPVLKDFSGEKGVDRIYEFLKCIRLEQIFLKGLPPETIRKILEKHDSSYEDMIENLCEIILTGILIPVLAKKSLGERLEPSNVRELEMVFMEGEPERLCGQLEEAVEVLVKNYYGNCRELTEYLSGVTEGIALRLKHAAREGTLSQML